MSDKQLVWTILANDPARIAQISTQELVGLAKRRGLVTYYKRVDYWLTYIMDHIHDDIDVLRILRTWLNYNLPLTPGRMKSFDRFHKTFLNVILNKWQTLHGLQGFSHKSN
jgi:hypothetical protein